MDNNLINQIKQNLGFSDKKTAIFLALLQLGEARVAEISAKSKLKRTTVYNILPELINEGLVAKTSTKNSKRYFITDPRIVLQILESRTESTKSLLPLLMSLHTISAHQPKISVYEGEVGARQIYEDTLLTNPGDTIYGFIGNIDTNPIPKNDLEIYIKNRINNKIKNKIIVAPSAYADFLKIKNKEELREIRTFADSENIKFPSVDIKIYNNKIAIISYRENFLGIMIESKDISQMCKIIFESLWDKLK